MSDDEVKLDLKTQFAGRTMHWGGVEFVSRTLDDQQIEELKRLHKWQESRRQMLLEGMLYRPAMYIGVGEQDPRFLLCIVTVIEWTMHDLCDLTTNKKFRDFFALHHFGPLGLGKVVDKSKTWAENRDELKRWIKLFLDWLENPLDQIVKVMREPD